MKITYDILKNLLKYNKNITLKFQDNSTILDVLVYNNVVSSLELDSTNIEDHSEEIYNNITNLDNINMYIPKIYIKENY